MFPHKVYYQGFLEANVMY